MIDVQVRRGGDVILVREADVRVLNGLDLEIERQQRAVDARNEHERGSFRYPLHPGYQLAQSRAEEKLSCYHPHGAFPRKSLKALQRAGLVREKRRPKQGGIEWQVTPDGDALLEERADDLPGFLCRMCWDADALPDLQVEAEGRGWWHSEPNADGLCRTCLEDALEEARVGSVKWIAEKRAELDRDERQRREYRERLLAALELLPDE